MLKLASSDTNKLSEELDNLLLNVIHALSTMIVTEEFLREGKIISDLMETLLRVTQPDLQLPMVSNYVPLFEL